MPDARTLRIVGVCVLRLHCSHPIRSAGSSRGSPGPRGRAHGPGRRARFRLAGTGAANGTRGAKKGMQELSYRRGRRPPAVTGAAGVGPGPPPRGLCGV